jgi:hypothetical protein
VGGAQIAALVAEAREVNEEALQALKSMKGIEALPLVIVRRKAFPNSFSNGLTVTEQLPKDAKAVGELLSIVEALYTQKVDNGY